MTVISRPPSGMSGKMLAPFLALAFGLTWGLGVLLVLFTDQITAIFGEVSLSNPVIIIMVYSPGIAGAFLVGKPAGRGPVPLPDDESHFSGCAALRQSAVDCDRRHRRVAEP